MKDKDFAVELLERLNELLDYSPATRQDISNLFKRSVAASLSTVTHPTLQVPIGPGAELSPVGLLNGIAGRITSRGPLRGMGLIAAVVEDDGSISKFVLTESV